MRSQSSDFLQVSRFWATLAGQRSFSRGVGGRSVAGFSSCTPPGFSISSHLYREGQQIYGNDYAGIPTFKPVTLSRGVMRGDGSFYNWAKEAAEGGEYIEDLVIYQFGREAMHSASFRTVAQQLTSANYQANNLFIDVMQAKPMRLLKLKSARPSDYSPTQEMNASTSEISIMSLEVTYSNYEEEFLSAD